MSKPVKHFNKAIVYILIGILVITSIFAVMMFGPRPGPQSTMFDSTLRYYTKGTEKLFYTDYAQSIVQDIKEVGILVTDYQMEYSTFLDQVFGAKEYEMAIIELEGQNAPHFEFLFKEGASLNVFNFQNAMDNGTTLNLINNITQEIDFHARKNLLFALQEHLMNNVVPMVPIFTPARIFAYWDNLEGFTSKWGISDSLPYMSFNGLHSNQESVTELKIGIGGWFDLCPLTMREAGEKLIVSLIMDKLIHLDEKGSPTKYGLIDSWEYLNQTTLLLHVRDNVQWQPDVDGIFTSEEHSIDDVIFTLDLITSIHANVNYQLYNWIDSYEVYNGTTVAVHIDSVPETAEREPYAFALEDLSVYTYPGYYLDVESTIEEIVESTRWIKYKESPFGTGKYRFNATESHIDLTAFLERFDSWHGIGVDPGKTTNLVFETIETQTVPDSYSMNLELQEGNKIDIADFGKDPGMEIAIPDENFRIGYKVENSLIFIAFNLENDVFGGSNNYVPTNETGVSKALAIRKALSSLVHKTFLNNAFHEGKYNISDSPVSRYYTDYYNPSVTTYPYSISEAIEFLKLAGFNISTETNGSVEESSYGVISSIVALGIFTAITITLRIRKQR